MKKPTFIIALFVVFLSEKTATQTPQKSWAKDMAATIMKTYPDSIVVKKYINHMMQDKEIAVGKDPETAQRERPALWGYEIGVVLRGFERLSAQSGNALYAEYTRRMVDHFITSDGNIRTYNLEEYNSDNIPTGCMILSLYRQTGDEKYRKAAALLRQQLAWQPRNRAGGFWHKLKYPTQMWLDGLYMIEPFYADYSLTFNELQNFDDIVKQFVLLEKHTRDPKSGLLFHGWDESKQQRWCNPKTGQSQEFWSRAIGWYAVALVDVLDFLPKTHPKRPILIAMLNRVAVALKKYQDPTSGVWYQITDKAGVAGNYLESSGSSMFVFALLKGIRMGYLDKTFLPTATKGFAGILKTFIETDANGGIHLTKACAGAGLGGEPYRDGTYDYYIKEPQRTDDLKAVGPFIQAALEIELLPSKGK